MYPPLLLLLLLLLIAAASAVASPPSAAAGSAFVAAPPKPRPPTAAGGRSRRLGGGGGGGGVIDRSRAGPPAPPPRQRQRRRGARDSVALGAGPTSDRGGGDGAGSIAVGTEAEVRSSPPPASAAAALDDDTFGSPDPTTEAWAESAERALLRSAEGGGDGGLPPTPEEFASVIEAWLDSALRRSPHSSPSPPSSSSSSSDGGGCESAPAPPLGAEGAVSRAESLLDRMEEIHEPDGALYRRVASAWCSVAVRARTDREEVDDDEDADDGGGEDCSPRDARAEECSSHRASRRAMVRAESILDRMEGLYAETGNEGLRPGVSTYAAVMDAWKTLGTGEDALGGAAAELERLRRRRDEAYPSTGGADSVGGYDGEDAAVRGRISSHRDVMRLLNRIDGGGGGGDGGGGTVRAKLIYGRLGKEELLDVDGREAAPPRAARGGRNGALAVTLNYNVIMDALAKSGETWAGRRAQDVLEYMADQSASGRNPNLKPDVTTVNSCVNAWARSGEPDSASRAEGVLDVLRSWREGGTPTDVDADTATYNTVLHAWCLSSDPDAAERAERVLAAMEEGAAAAPPPDSVSYASVLNAWARRASRDPSSVGRAEAVLKRMHGRHKLDGDNAAPDVRCFNALLDAHANSGDVGAGRRALRVLRLMEDWSDAGNVGVRPDLYTYNTVIKALSKSRGSRSARQALELLDSMEERREGGSMPFGPDVVTYNTVIDAFARSGQKGSAMSAERLLRRMDRSYREGTGGDVRPDARTITGVVNAWAYSGERGSARRAEKIFESFRSGPGGSGYVEPDTVAYNSLLNCWAKSGDWAAAQRADDILRRMEEEAGMGEDDWGDDCAPPGEASSTAAAARPDVKTYTSALDAFARSRERWAPRRAEEVLGWMERMYSETGDASVRPNALTYVAVMNCWARSGDHRVKASRARDVLYRMEEQYRAGNMGARPNVVAYNVVLNACAHTSGDTGTLEEAFRIACLTFEEIRTSDRLRPTHVTYATFLDICARLMPEGELRRDLARRVFHRCRLDGMVSDLVLRRLRGAIGSDLYEGLLEGAEEDDLPSQWTKNVSYRVPSVIG